LRRLLIPLLAVAALAAAAPAGTSAAKSTPGETYSYGARGQAPRIAITRGQAIPGFTGGPVTASDGETVTVYVSDDLLAADAGAAQRWADALVDLLHGPEMSQVTLNVATVDQVRQICGAGALGCYDGRSDTIVALGQDTPGVTALSVVTHEYGHHVANSRRNDPWNAVEWGTKRWASAENVCRKTRAGELVPGDEGRFYTLNPGEAFAEDYRVLNERRAGLPESRWQVVDRSLYPDQEALDSLAEDITNPWTANMTTTYRSVLGPHASGRGFRVATPLDGIFVAKLTSPAKTKFVLRLVDPTTSTVLGVAAPTGRVESIQISACGQRTIQVQVKRVSGSGAFTLAVSKP
jgi:hypothetical protein